MSSHFHQIGQAIILAVFLQSISAAPSQAEQVREFYINTVHIDGNANINGDASHPPEAFPKNKDALARGIMLTPPDIHGSWKIRSFAFLPSQLIVNEGDNVRLNFVGVQGVKHTIQLRGESVDTTILLQRGHIETFYMPNIHSGLIHIKCLDHQPNMNGEIIILPKDK